MAQKVAHRSNGSFSVRYEIPSTTHSHKSMLLRGVRLPKQALDRHDIEALRRTLDSSGRSHGGVPLGRNGSDGGRRGDRVNYAPRGMHSNGRGGNQQYQSARDRSTFGQHQGYNSQRQQLHNPPPPMPSFQQRQPWIPPPPGHPNFGQGMPPPPPSSSHPYDNRQWGPPGVPPGPSRAQGNRHDWQSQPQPAGRGQHRGGGRGRGGSYDPRRDFGPGQGY